MAGRKKTIPDEAILRVFVLHPDPVLHSTELVEPLGLTRQGIHSRLTELEEIGHLESKKIANARIWWLTPTGRERVWDSEY